MILDDAGVWNRHLQIEFRSEGWFAKSTSTAISTINADKFEQSQLRNGDILGVGQARLQFYLEAPGQISLVSRELFCWLIIGSIPLFQILLIYWLQRAF